MLELLAHPIHYLHGQPLLPPPAQLPLLAALLLSSKQKMSTRWEKLACPTDKEINSQYVGELMYLVLSLLSSAVTVITLRVGLHGHGREKVLHGIVAEIIAYCAKLQQIPKGQNVQLNSTSICQI